MIVPILGMHRSGTSALAGLVHHAGVLMGCDQSFKPKPLPENPKGFFENYDFRCVNDDILQSNPQSYEVKSWSAEIPPFVGSRTAKKRGLSLIKSWQKRSPHWGWKDPRTCLTYPLWYECFVKRGVLAEVKPVLVIRSPAAVAESLRVRNELPLEQGLALWAAYNSRIFNDLEKYHSEFCILCYEDLLAGDAKGSLPRLEQYLGIAIRDTLGFLDKDLNRNGSEEFTAACPVPEVQSLAERLFSHYKRA